MFSKKKPVAVLPRSRFVKAKPKIGPKSSQNSSQIDVKLENSSNATVDTSLNEKDKNVEISIHDAKRSSLGECKDLSPFPAHHEENSGYTASRKNSSDSPKCQDSARTESYHDNLSSCLDNSEKFLKKNSESVLDSKSCKDDLCKDFATTYVNKEEIRSTIESIGKDDSRKNLIASPNKIHTIADEQFCGSASEYAHKILSSDEPKTNAESPEKAVSLSPTKPSSGSILDKSSKYPCLTKILSAPKKRPQNSEILERKKRMASFKELPPRSQMTFTDLIYWNPNTSPMKSKQKKQVPLFDPKEKEPSDAEEEAEDDGEEGEDNATLVPKLFVNENGEIIIDESSLVIKRKKKAVDMISEAINMDDIDVSYGSFRRKVSKKWCPKETVNFYKALSVVGTDFALMENIMPNRTRRELKIKFKKEEKINNELLQRAMYETDTFQSDLSPEDLNLDVIDIPGLEECIAKDWEKQAANRGRKRKGKVLTEIASNDVDETTVGTDDLPVIKGRGRPKGKKNAIASSELINLTFPSEHENSVEENEFSPIVRAKRKAKVLSQDSMEDNDDLFEIQVQVNSTIDDEESIMSIINSNICPESTINPEESPTDVTENTLIEENEFSPIVQVRRKAKVLSQESEEDNGNTLIEEKDFSPILQVRRKAKVLSQESEEDNGNTLIEETDSPVVHVRRKAKVLSQDSDKDSDLGSNVVIKIEKPSFPESVTAAVVKEIKTSNASEIDATAETTKVLNESDGEKLLFASSNSNQSNIPQNSDQVPRASSPANDVIAAYRRTRRVKAQPNVKIQKNTNIEISQIVEENAFLILPESLSIIDVLDDKFLSDGVTDVVTTPVETKRQKPKQNNAAGKKQHSDNLNAKKRLQTSKHPAVKIKAETCHMKHDVTNASTHAKQLQPSYLNFTPVIDECDECAALAGKGIFAKCSNCNALDEPRVQKMKNRKTYSRKKAPEFSPAMSVNSPSCSLQVPVITPDAHNKLKKVNSSPFVATLNKSSKQAISIPMTPEPASDVESLMTVNSSPTGKSLNFHFFNNFGGTPLPPEILIPPSSIILKSEN